MQSIQADTTQQKPSLLPSANQTARNIVLLWGHKLAYILASLVVMGVATRFYGLEEMGIWIFGTTMASYISLMDFGSASALPRTLPRLLNEGRIDKASQIVSCAFLIGVTVVFVGLLVMACGGVQISQALLVGTSGSSGHHDVLIVVIVAALIGLPLKISYGLLASVSRFDIYFGVDLLGVIVRVALILLVVLKLQVGIFVFALVSVIPPLLANGIQYYLGIRFSKVSVTVFRLSRSAFQELMSHTGASLMLTFSTMLLAQGSILAAAKLGTASVAALAIPLMLVTQAASFSASLGALVTPVASSLAEDKDDKLAKVTFSVIASAASMSIPIVLILFFVGPLFVQWWLDLGHSEQDAMNKLVHSLQLLTLGGFFIGPAAAARGILLGSGRHWQSVMSEIVSTVIALSLGLILLNTTSIGVLSLAIGVSIGFILRFFSAALVLMTVVLLSKVDLFFAIAKPAVLLFLSGYVPTVIIGFPEANSSPYEAFAQVIFGAAIWVAGTWWFVLTPSMRSRLAGRIHKVFFGVQ